MISKRPFGERCLQFGIAILEMIGGLSNDYRKSVAVRQLEKSATSIGANVAEAQSAQSRADFISKFEIALKEARETDYWLRLMKGSGLVGETDVRTLIGECWQITAILVSSVKTAKKNAESGTMRARVESRDQN